MMCVVIDCANYKLIRLKRTCSDREWILILYKVVRQSSRVIWLYKNTVKQDKFNTNAEPGIFRFNEKNMDGKMEWTHGNHTWSNCINSTWKHFNHIILNVLNTLMQQPVDIGEDRAFKIVNWTVKYIFYSYMKLQNSVHGVSCSTIVGWEKGE